MQLERRLTHTALIQVCMCIFMHVRMYIFISVCGRESSLKIFAHVDALQAWLEHSPAWQTYSRWIWTAAISGWLWKPGLKLHFTAPL